MELLVDGMDLKLDGRCLSNYVKNHIIGIDYDYTYKFKLLKLNKMKNYEITVEQIKEMETWGNSKDAQKVREQWFPEVFKTLFFKEGNWYYDKGNDWLFCYKGENRAFGFVKNVYNDDYSMCSTIGFEPATDSEVLEALTNEAIKRGLTEKKYILSAKSGNLFKSFERNYYIDEEGCFRLDGIVIMKDGKWAEIVKTYTKEEAEKMLNAKII